MNFTEEQNAFRDSIQKVVARHVAPVAAEIDATDRFPTEIVKLFGEMGLMQLWVPEQYGGPNGNLTMVCIAREEISKVSPACASIAGLNSMFIMPLLHFGSEEQRRKYLPIIAGGTESMTRAPFVMGKADSAFSRTATSSMSSSRSQMSAA